MDDAVGDIFRVRLNCVDHYQHPPSTLDPPLWGPWPPLSSSTQRNTRPSVPVIRIFGSTETGQKVCAHIHGALPYLYIAYTESLEEDAVQRYIAALRSSIDHALAVSYRRNPYSTTAARDATFVAHIALVKGVPFFGYAVGYRPFLKIYMLNPAHMTRFADLLSSGAILQRVLQPYEAHLQYLLQWMCDFNLFGCAYVEVAAENVRWRMPLPPADAAGAHRWHDGIVSEHVLLPADTFPRQSHCGLEIDLRVEDLLNHLRVDVRLLHHALPEPLLQDRKLVPSMAGLWRDETRRRKKRMGLEDSGSSPFPPEVLISMSAGPRAQNGGAWIHEEEFREMIEGLAQKEKAARGGGSLCKDDFIASTPVEKKIPTVYESIALIFQATLEAAYEAEKAIEESANRDVDAGYYDEDDFTGDFVADAELRLSGRSQNSEVLVDIKSAVKVGVGDDVDNDYGSDEDLAREIALTQAMQKNGMKRRKVNGSDSANVNSDYTEDEYAYRNGSSPLRQPLRSAEDTPSKPPTTPSSQGRFKRVKIDENLTQSPTKTRPFHLKETWRENGVRHASPGKTDPVSAKTGVKSEDTYRDFSNVPSFQIPPPSPSNNFNPHMAKTAFGSGDSLRLSQQNDPRNLALRSSGEQNRKSEPMTSSGSTDGLSGPSYETPLKSAPQKPIDPRLVVSYARMVSSRTNNDIFLFGHRPPTFEEVEGTVSPSMIYQDAYYSKEKDVPLRPREYGGKEFRLESNTLPYLPAFDKHGGIGKKSVQPARPHNDFALQRRQRECSFRNWQIMQPPPTYEEVEKWLKDDEVSPLEPKREDLDVEGPLPASQLKRKNRAAPELSQIEGPTQANRHGFKFATQKPSTSVQHETGYMSTMSLEVHVNSRGDLAPDPEKDEVNMVVWCLQDECLDEGGSQMGIVLSTSPDDEDLPERVRRMVGQSFQLDIENDELDVLNTTVDIVRALDPDILTGFEVHNGSWGYLIERARLKYEYNLTDELSRTKSQSHGRFGKDADRWGFTHTSTVSITGRHTINIWRAMRAELNLLQYTMENIVFHLLHRRIPHYSFATLTQWYQSRKPRDLKKVLDYLITRTKLDLDILEANELVPRTSEQARLLGVDFFSVFSRGSQFKVESLMFRIAKPESFVLVSPTRKQVGSQNALECLPLVMEPQSAFYTSPLLVLDFQSLYPSVMIAYNYCYSTCLGRVADWRGTNKLGFADFRRTPGLLELVKDQINIAPNGLMYVKPEMRKSLLAKMLGEILETRVMVKSGMKVDKKDVTLQRLLNNRQLALKLIANVTYGYTSASFSGRMPCAEIADSIVQTGRETLEKAIAFIHSVERWDAEVVYGDTDSLFVYLKGRTREQAFKIGDEIAAAVTDMNPRPVKLKFEKVYHPCVLLTKKRYVGFKYESLSQTTPEFDAKGIETVRRDGTPAEQKIEEKALKILFRTSDLSEVKRYFQAQCNKIMTGRVSIQDFCFAKEVKLGSYSDKGVPPPGALIASRRMLRDPRTEPQYGERVPYVVRAGAPGARLWERCVEPEALLFDPHADLDAEYYITKNLIPPLDRIFVLVGATVQAWYDEMPRVQRIRAVGSGIGDTGLQGKSVRTMESYMRSSLCAACRTKLPPPARRSHEPDPLPLCDTCRRRQPARTLLSLRNSLHRAQRKANDLLAVCRSCADVPAGDEVRCDSRDCPVFYTRVKAGAQLRVAESGVGEVLTRFEEEVALSRALKW